MQEARKIWEVALLHKSRCKKGPRGFESMLLHSLSSSTRSTEQVMVAPADPRFGDYQCCWAKTSQVEGSLKRRHRDAVFEASQALITKDYAAVRNIRSPCL